VLFIIVVAFDVGLSGYMVYVLSQTGLPFVSQTTVPYHLAITPNNKTSTIIFDVVFDVVGTNGIIAGEPLTMSGFVKLNLSTNSTIFNNIRIFNIGFIGSFQWPPLVDQNGLPFQNGLSLGYVTGLSASATNCCVQFYFPQAGIYTPYMNIVYANGSLLVFRFSNSGLVVSPQSQAQATYASNINEVLTVALVVFALVESVSGLESLWDRSSIPSLFRRASRWLRSLRGRYRLWRNRNEWARYWRGERTDPPSE
jgi:hypothetical protein